MRSPLIILVFVTAIGCSQLNNGELDASRVSVTTAADGSTELTIMGQTFHRLDECDELDQSNGQSTWIPGRSNWDPCTSALAVFFPGCSGGSPTGGPTQDGDDSGDDTDDQQAAEDAKTMACFTSAIPISLPVQCSNCLCKDGSPHREGVTACAEGNDPISCVYQLYSSAQVCESECAAVQPPSTGAGPDAGQHATCVDFVTWTGHASLGEGSRDCAECVCQSESNQNSVLACKEAGAGSSACQAASRLSGGACGSVCTPPDPTPPATPPQDDTGGAGDEQLACYLEGIFSGWSESCAACMCSPTLFIPIPISATTWCFEEHGATNCIEAPQCIKEYTDNVNDNWNKYVSSSGANSAYGTVAGLDKHFCCLEKDATGGCASHLLDSDQGRLYLSEMAFGTCAQACQSDL